MAEPLYCCEELRLRSTLTCGSHTDAFHCADVLLIWSESSNTWGLPVRDGGEPSIKIDYCPWCSADLPVEPCACGGDRWMDDENWSPDYPGEWRGERTPGNGRIPCGFCNQGGWGEDDPGATYRPHD